jgi:thiol-disulfide isomerase/thioredoxin
LRLAKTGNPAEVSISWEDLRKDAMQVGDDGAQPTPPVRAYSIWRGTIGDWSSHTGPGNPPVANGIEGSAVTSAVRSAAVPVEADESHYFLVSGRGNNLEGTLGSGPGGEYAGYTVTDLCDTIGEYSPPVLSNLFKCAPEVTLYDHHGKLRHLSEFRGHPVWIDLPAEWCGPCIAEANEMESIYLDYEGRGVKVISMLMDEEQNGPEWNGRPTQAECRAWGDRAGTDADHTFECWADPVHCTGNPCTGGTITQEAWPKFNAFSALPTNLIVDQGGRVVWTEAGWSVENVVRNRLNKLVGATDSCLH